MRIFSISLRGTGPKGPDETELTMEVLEALDPACELWKVCRELELLGVDSEVLSRSFSSLSGGEQTKVLFGPALFGRRPVFAH